MPSLKAHRYFSSPGNVAGSAAHSAASIGISSPPPLRSALSEGVG